MRILANVAELWVFSRTVDSPRHLALESSQHKAAYERADAPRVEELLTFRALLEGFAQLRRYITECPEPRGEFRLA